MDKPKKIINTIKLTQDECNIYSKLENDKQIIKIIKKLQKNEINNIVIEKEFYNNLKFINYINSSNIKIFDGRWLAKYLIIEMLEYIIKQKNIKKEETEIAITVNEITELSIDTIKILAIQYKKIIIVTNHINKLRKIEKELYEKQGILIILSNNQKRSLIKSQIIINMDFNNEVINKYNINESAIVLNLEGNVKIQSKRFNGININNYEIEIQNKGLINENINYFNRDILESKIYNKDTFRNIRKNIKIYGVNIKELYGVYGRIDKY